MQQKFINFDKFELHHGDCLNVLKTLPENSVDSIVTDPPYGLSNHSQTDVMECLTAWISGKAFVPSGSGFMGKTWDAWVPGPEVWRECLRVLKPGGYIMVFAGTRSMDLMCMALRISGFELRDSIDYAHDDSNQAPVMAWCYGSGFPKGLNISKAIDAAAGCEQKIIGIREDFAKKQTIGSRPNTANNTGFVNPQSIGQITEPSSDEAKKWSGWNTSLKPAWEPIIMARKSLSEKTIVSNVLKHGTGALNIDACRIEVDQIADLSQLRTMNRNVHEGSDGWGMSTIHGDSPQVVNKEGRWPSNVCHDGSDIVVNTFPQSLGQQGNVTNHNSARQSPNGIFGKMNAAVDHYARKESNDSAARFFYCAKASSKDRHEGMDDPGFQFKHNSTLRNIENTNSKKGNYHPTVKPTKLLRYLCKLITPTGGVVLDPFAGSGSTGKAALLERFRFIGIEREADYFNIAKERISHVAI